MDAILKHTLVASAQALIWPLRDLATFLPVLSHLAEQNVPHEACSRFYPFITEVSFDSMTSGLTLCRYASMYICTHCCPTKQGNHNHKLDHMHALSKCSGSKGRSALGSWLGAVLPH